MANAERLYWLHALTPLHVGMGRGEGYIDLPVMRERVTNFPFVPGSSVKGVFADVCGATDDARNPKKEGQGYDNVLHAAFGRAGDDQANSGSLVFGDARLVCLAVRSLYGTFAWCTSPLVLKRLARDLGAAGFTGWPSPPPVVSEAHVPHEQGDPAKADSYLTSGTKLYLEDLDVTANPCATARAWATQLGLQVFTDSDSAWRAEFTKRFVVLPDDLFDFLAETATEVQPHVRIDPDFKRVARGQLWYEESLPAESILCGLLWCDEPRGVQVPKGAVLDLLKEDRVLQMGGKATTGKGRIQLRFTKAASAGSNTTGRASPDQAEGGDA